MKICIIRAQSCDVHKRSRQQFYGGSVQWNCINTGRIMLTEVTTIYKKVESPQSPTNSSKNEKSVLSFDVKLKAKRRNEALQKVRAEAKNLSW